MRGRGGAWAVVLTAAAVLAAACESGDAGIGAGSIEGSGSLATESREVAGFEEVVLVASGNVTVDVTGTESLTIEADDNILPLLTSDVSGGRLELGVERGTSISPTSITWRLTAKDLSAITILGGGDFTISGVDAGSFSTTIDGAGNVEVSGSADELTVQINGAGDFRGEGLAARIGSVSIPGSGSAVVNVTDQLDVSIPGAGDVQYIGEPTVTSDIPGVGDVSPR